MGFQARIIEEIHMGFQARIIEEILSICTGGVTGEGFQLFRVHSRFAD